MGGIFDVLYSCINTFTASFISKRCVLLHKIVTAHSVHTPIGKMTSFKELGCIYSIDKTCVYFIALVPIQSNALLFPFNVLGWREGAYV